MQDIVWSAALFAPWITKSDTGYEGILYDILVEASKKANLKLVVKPTPIIRIYTDLDAGSAHFSVIPMLDPEKHSLPSKQIVVRASPIFQNRVQVFANSKRKEALGYSGKALGEHRLGTLSIPARLKNVSSFPDFVTEETEIVGFSSDRALVKALKTGRVDLALASVLSFIKEASDLGIANDFYEVPGSSFLSGTYVIWSKKSDKSIDSDVVVAFFEALSAVSCDGTVERIFKAWVVREFYQSDLKGAVLENISDAISGYCQHELLPDL